MLLHVGARTAKSSQLKPPEEVAQRRHYLPLLGMILLALLFKASPATVLMAEYDITHACPSLEK